ncbi:AAA family ATPase [Intestinibacter sp.]|uniref:AAA family ATPase n=1 Tax=Intestinibacter sp. TaxID=1965304 RepID=UPI003F13DF99
MKKIILCRGIQGSGKTSYSKQWVLEDPENRVRFNNDDIRNMLGKYWVTSRELLVSCLKKAFLSYSMLEGYDIIIDNMNLNDREVEFYKSTVKVHNDLVEQYRKNDLDEKNTGFKYEIEFKDFFIPLEECIRRDSLREHPIGEEVIRNTYNKYKHILENNYETNQTVIQN